MILTLLNVRGTRPREILKLEQREREQQYLVSRLRPDSMVNPENWD